MEVNICMKIQHLFEYKYWYHAPSDDFEYFSTRENHSDHLEDEPHRYGIDISRLNSDSDSYIDDMFDQAHEDGWVRISYGYEYGNIGSFVTAKNKDDVRKALKWMIQLEDFDKVKWPISAQWERNGHYRSVPINDDIQLDTFIKRGSL